MKTAQSRPNAKAGAATNTSKETRFQQASDLIWSNLAVEHTAEHAALPSEREVAEDYDVSRMTARRALEALEIKGLIYSEERRGRFVSPPRVKYDISHGYNFFEDAQARGMMPDIEVLRAQEIEASEQNARKIAAKLNERIYQFTRRFRSNGRVVFLKIESVLAKQFPNFLKTTFINSLLAVLNHNTRPTQKLSIS